MEEGDLESTQPDEPCGHVGGFENVVAPLAATLKEMDVIWYGDESPREAVVEAFGIIVGEPALATLEHPVGYALCWLDATIGRLGQAGLQLDANLDNPRACEHVLREMAEDFACFAGLVSYLEKSCHEFSPVAPHDPESIIAVGAATREFAQKASEQLGLPLTDMKLPGEPPGLPRTEEPVTTTPKTWFVHWPDAAGHGETSGSERGIPRRKPKAIRRRRGRGQPGDASSGK